MLLSDAKAQLTEKKRIKFLSYILFPLSILKLLVQWIAAVNRKN